MAWCMGHTNALIALVHWVFDFHRVSKTPSLVRFPNKNAFMGSIKLSRDRAKMRDHRSHDSEKFSIAANPKKMTKPQEFPVFIVAPENKLAASRAFP